MVNKLELKSVYQDEIIKVSLEDAFQLIYVEWLKHPGSEEFRRSFKIAADIGLQQQCRYWLSDARAIHFIAYADQNWMLQEMVPLIKLSSLIKFARITTKESLASFDTYRIYNLVDSLPEKVKTKLEVFTDKQAAIEWLFADETSPG